MKNDKDYQSFANKKYKMSKIQQSIDEKRKAL